MRKIGVLLLIGCLALLVSSAIFAANPTSAPIYAHPERGDLDLSGKSATNADVGDTATLKAWVTPYAEIKFGDQYNIGRICEKATDKGLIFSGAGAEEKYGKIIYTLETNCDVNVDGFGTAFKGTKDGLLTTSYALCPQNQNYDANPGYINGWRTISGDGYVWAPEAFDHKFEVNTVKTYKVYFKASTGPNISSQRAGKYTANYIVTVWEPQNLN